MCDIKLKPNQVNFIKLVNGKMDSGEIISDQDEKKNKPKAKRDVVVENSSISEIQKRNDVRVKLPEGNNDDYGLSKLKKELLFSHNNSNRINNPNVNTLTFETKSNQIDHKK